MNPDDDKNPSSRCGGQKKMKRKKSWAGPSPETDYGGIRVAEWGRGMKKCANSVLPSRVSSHGSGPGSRQPPVRISTPQSFFSRWQKGVNSAIRNMREYNTTACTVFVAQNRSRKLVAESKAKCSQPKTLTLCSQRFCRSDRLIIGRTCT